MRTPFFTSRLSRPALRFRRWSRRRYAAFVSIHREVTMGQLASRLADRFQAKQLSLHAGMGSGEAATPQVEEAADSGDPDWVAGIPMPLCALMPTADIVPAPVLPEAGTAIFPSEIRSGKYPNAGASRFFCLFLSTIAIFGFQKVSEKLPTAVGNPLRAVKTLPTAFSSPLRVVKTLPTAFSSLLRVVKTLPTAFSNPLKGFKTLPTAVGNPLKGFRTLPTAVGNPLKAFRTLPTAVGSPPKLFRTLPTAVSDPPKYFGTLPTAVGNFPAPFYL